MRASFRDNTTDMGKNFLGIDYGERRIGLASGDDLGFASPIPAAVEATPEERLAHIAMEIKRRRIHELVVGYPLNMDGTEGKMTAKVDTFITLLEQRFALPVHRVDEGLSSSEAESGISTKKKGHGGAARKAHRATGEIDSRAASVILQDFLNAQGYGMLPPPDEPYED